MTQTERRPERASAAVPPNDAPLAVASVPAGHVYVRHLAPEQGASAARLPDPDPLTPDKPAGAVWWPPVMLDAAWLRTAEFDVFHLHFGFDACDPAQLAGMVRVLKQRRKPFVFTVHDLRNPHHAARELHDRQLDVLVPAADAVVTLTPGAADEIRRRWGREALVLPHPHVVDLRTMAVAQAARGRRRTGPFRVGLHVKSLRPSMDPMRILPTLVETVRELPDAVLQVNAHRDVLDVDGRRRDVELAEYLHAHADEKLIDLRVHDYLSDRELWAYLGSLDASVLPYRFGTHSGWLEACRDLGVTVIAPTCGYFTQQGPALSYAHDESGFDRDSLAAALVTAYEDRPRFGAGIEDRRQQRQQVARAHEDLYRSLVG
ncbi:glycosyltransferase [Nocardioides sp. SR21]|uniref:glycosyltransferase n=1 Tax=Nocardioides sp. SR21 TaxID=2919501 RepID=UPI001FAB1F3D|nr:glycosyltransferase [Nocardioides sp. SR21]